MKTRNLPEPVFTNYEHSFYVRFVNNEKYNVTDRKKQVLFLIDRNRYISTSGIADKLNLSKRTILRDINVQKSYGYIGRIGSENSVYWEIKKLENGK